MNRTDELRKSVLDVIESDIREYEDGGDSEMVQVDYITMKRVVELLKKMEVPVYATWHYYINEEDSPRWKCTNCGKIVRRPPHDKHICSKCGAHIRMEN